MTRRYETPEGRMAFYARPILGLRQHLAFGLFPTSTACGHPVNGWSSEPIRTPIGMTCRACIRNVTKHGRIRNSPGAWILYFLVWPAYKIFERRETGKQPEPIDAASLFPKKPPEERIP